MQLNRQYQTWERHGERMCGRTTPENVITESENNRIMFRSNADINGDGFSVSLLFNPVDHVKSLWMFLFSWAQIVWNVACGEIFNGTESGEFSSPGYPSLYSNNLRCDYTIVGDPEDYITLTFLEPFELENRKAYSDKVSENLGFF